MEISPHFRDLFLRNVIIIIIMIIIIIIMIIIIIIIMIALLCDKLAKIFFR